MTRSRFIPVLILGVTGAAGAAVPAAHAQIAAAASGPVAPVQALYAELTRIEAQAGSSFAQRAQALAPVIDRTFDIPAVLKKSVGLRYESLPAAQKQQLLDQFRQFTVARYVSNFKPGGGDRFTVDPTPTASPIPGQQVVHSRIVAGDGSTDVNYVMGQNNGGWQVVDVLLNGNISQVAVQRSDFSSSLSSGDATALIDSLRRKTQAFAEG
ncbi:MAG: ABC transporter substrate-binding protein [Gluconacetobacter diazotrophicus]|nr:ABC transporter substrate-binding protein [Gluconacetobacter diazotrophicus]